MFNNPLSETLYNSSQSVLKLTPDSGFTDLLTINTLTGETIGSIQVFQGLRIEKMVISEFVTGPGMVASLVVIKPDYHYNVPRFGFDFNQTGDRLHLDIDLFPHRDLTVEIDYYRRYYTRLQATYQRACEQFTTAQPKGQWLRNFISPCFFMTDANPDRQATLQALAEDYLQNWLAIWAEQHQTVDNVSLQQITKRAQYFKTLSMQHNPVKDTFISLLGEPLAIRALSTLY